MSLRMKLLGKKLNQETTTELAEAFGIDMPSFLRAYNGWSLNDFWGYAITKPVKTGIEVELEIFRKLYHFCDESAPFNTIYSTHMDFAGKTIIPYKNPVNGTEGTECSQRNQ